jgi:hypothetical protein
VHEDGSAMRWQNSDTILSDVIRANVDPVKSVAIDDGVGEHISGSMLHNGSRSEC